MLQCKHQELGYSLYSTKYSILLRVRRSLEILSREN
jgi:hypothetical protein